MPKESNQKQKLFYVRKYLNEKTNEEHPAKAKDILNYLENNNIFSERKSIYNDIECLRMFGDDIIYSSGKFGGYYVGQREFTLPELKLLVDSVQASNFITPKKSLELIDKITKLTNEYDANQLNRQVYVINRAKATNEKSYYNVDSIHKAIIDDKSITFNYYSYNERKEKVIHNDGNKYKVSPYALIWDNDNYYLLAYNLEHSSMRHYRVDRMENVDILKEKRVGKEIFEKYDLSTYTQSVFGMFNAEMKTVTLKVNNELAGVILDRFGTNLIMVPDNNGNFFVDIKVAVSSQFYSWVFGFGNKMEIISPDEVRNDMFSMIKSIKEIYK